MPSSNQIKDLVAKYYGLTTDELDSERRKGPVVGARQLASLLVREVTGLSLQQTATVMKRKDHTTIIYAIKQAKAKIETCEDFKHDYHMLLGTLGGKPKPVIKPKPPTLEQRLMSNANFS